jgi:hypothetical protein
VEDSPVTVDSLRFSFSGTLQFQMYDETNSFSLTRRASDMARGRTLLVVCGSDAASRAQPGSRRERPLPTFDSVGGVEHASTSSAGGAAAESAESPTSSSCDGFRSRVLQNAALSRCAPAIAPLSITEIYQDRCNNVAVRTTRHR